MNTKSHKMVLGCLEAFPEKKVSSLLDYIEFLKDYDPDKDRIGAGDNRDRPNGVPEAGP